MPGYTESLLTNTPARGTTHQSHLHETSADLKGRLKPWGQMLC